ncbi:D-sedoheptulose-7-phosphate isomerase [Draconibacterium mangrovi]|uniref:D-sedoheptulose-7-phosphate isomerase n=1 Tax=Draconibacterium mangrovi TaxID=2697469 RepID=UPI0013D37E9C|nr:SIS domain-containing protein [Draconibacterium mangrovi]
MKRKEILLQHLTDYKASVIELLNLIDIDELNEVVTTMVDAFKNGNTVYIAGNGGSAATASHMQADFRFFVRYFTDFRPKVEALTDNIPLMTAIGNDNSFDDIFVEQMKGVFKKGDVLLSISASGNSTNVVKATEYAKELGGKTIAFVGFKGGKLKELSDISLFVPNKDKDYGPIEDIHMILDHLIVNYLAKDEEFLAIPAN